MSRLPFFAIWRVQQDMSQHCTTWLAPSVADNVDDACRVACTSHWVLEDVLRQDIVFVYARQGSMTSKLHRPVEYLEGGVTP